MARPGNRLAVAGVLVALVALLTAVGWVGWAQDATPHAAPNAVTIEAGAINWSQKEVTIPAGTDVRVMLPNRGQVPHNFSIDALGISVNLPVEQTVETMINAAAGTYKFYCNVPGHAPAGMVGTLIVH
ncbi:MAG: cupredoxin domain-containing protein [Chloroflexota bacterium]|nr:cupredoxin domain-containing protein [Chloroflexota bacterium]